jgi:hypothetical protein
VVYSAPPMESFLDRLLADARGSAPAAAAGADTAAATSDVDGALAAEARDVPRQGPPPGSAAQLPAAPRGTAAPRIAVYDTLTSPPRVLSVEADDLPALIASLAEKTYNYCREQGGQVPYTVINEVIENLIHAFFRDVVITILDNGQVIRISDHGPGVDDKEHAFLPGFTTATPEQRQVIRGVGSGLPIARESLAFLRGILTAEDNLGGGTVFTISLPSRPAAAAAPQGPEVKLTTRQKKVLVLLMELGSAGPTVLAKELGIAPATAFRDLGLLQKEGLIHSLRDGKRALTEEGVNLLDSIF